MKFGNQNQGLILMYSENSIQNIVGTWWAKEESMNLSRGRLIRAFLPHIHQIPNKIEAVGRTEATNHNLANVRISPLRVKERQTRSRIPCAGLPVYDDEVNVVYRCKKRPALVICEGGTEIDKKLTRNKPRWQSSPTILVAPYYGVEECEVRSGWSPEFVDRVRQCEYPQFMLDILPFGSNKKESMLNFTHIQPIGKHHDSIEMTEYNLSADALEIVDDWIDWILRGGFEEDSALLFLRTELMKLERL